MKVLAIATHGFEETELIAVVDTLIRGGHDVDIAFEVDEEYANSGHNIKIKVEKKYKDVIPYLDEYGALFIPGGIGFTKLDKISKTNIIISHFDNFDKYIGAICAAPTLLAKRGILKGKEATVFYDKTLEKILIKEGAILNKEIDKFKPKVVIDGKIITGNGMQASLIFGREFSKLLNKKGL